MKANITIPKDLSEVTLYQFQKYNKIVDENPEAYSFQDQKLVEIFCNIKLKYIRLMDPEDFENTVIDIASAFTKRRRFEDVRLFKLNGVEYGFEPDLERIKMGAYIDLEENLQSIDTMHKAMSILYRPVVHKMKDKYLITDYLGTNDDLLYMPADIALEAQIFFWRLGKELLKDIHLSLMINPKVVGNQIAKQHLHQLGVGIARYTHLQEASFLPFRKSLKEKLMNV